MSYEGYDEYLCANGHLRGYDVWESFDCDENGPFHTAPRCCSCGAPFVFRHSVDQTNGRDPDNPATMPYPFEVAQEAVTERCNLGCVHTVQETIYKIPEQVDEERDDCD